MAYQEVYINDKYKTYFQCPTSSESDCDETYFQNNDNKDFVFYMCDEHNRSELRFDDEWKFESGTKKVLKAKVKILELNNAFTMLQIHTDGGINKPILRVATYENKLKLFIYDGSEYVKKEIDRWNDESEIIGKELQFKIVVKDNYLMVYYQCKKQIRVPINVVEDNYFKLGVYLQKDGCAKDEIYDIFYKQ